MEEGERLGEFSHARVVACDMQRQPSGAMSPSRTAS
jgi:hypothetical protein